MSQEVVRRFEVHAAGSGPLVRVKLALEKADGQGLVHLLAPLNVVERPPLVQVRLTGAVAMVARVMDDIRRPDVQILRDFVDVPSDGAPGKIFPDPRPLLRISVKPRGPSEGPMRTPVGNQPPPPERRSVKVAIVDSGVMLDHVDLRPYLQQAPEPPKARYIGGTVDDRATDEDGHGTMLAGTILSIANLGPAIEIIPVKFFDASTRPIAENAAPAIDFARAQGADIITVSWELGSHSDDVRDAIARACREGKLVVFAAGNQGSDNDKVPAYPSVYAQEWPDQTITVMASDQYDEKAWFSNYGVKSVDIAAPGIGIVSTHPYVSEAAETGERPALRYCRYHGTSAATAHVVGAAALLKSLTPNLIAKDLKESLKKSVAKRPGLRCAFEGRLDLGKALAGVVTP